MTLVIFSSMSVALLCNSIFSTHPLVLTIKVLLLATTMCLTIAHTTTWYAYMLYMVMVGGMLVMFTYISSLSPNGVFGLKPQLTHLTILLASGVLVTYSTSLTPNTTNTQDHHNAPENFISFFLEDKTMSLLPMLAAILLLAMFMSMALLSRTKAPMRQTAFFSSYTTHKNTTP
uniref:NADH dehydrogenase subunit 6 n=1 Tax=Lamprotula leaii TaxID=1903488 RepID=A0A0C4G621_9BIVA|nr:NADH dehydrogenase subunit 6 [Lamprotula leaii]